MSADKEITLPACFGVKGNSLPVTVAGCWGPAQLTAKDGQVFVIQVLLAADVPDCMTMTVAPAAKHKMFSFAFGNKPWGKGSILAASYNSHRMCFLAALPLLWGFDLVIWSQSPKPTFITWAILSVSSKVTKPKWSCVPAEKNSRHLKQHQDLPIMPHIEFLQL